MSIYIASRFRNREAAKDLADRLLTLGVETTQTWPEVDFGVSRGAVGAHIDPDAEAKAALRDLSEIDRANWLVILTEGCEQTPGGLHFEAGYAIGMSKKLVVIGPRVNVFYHLPFVWHFQTVEHYLTWIESVQGIKDFTKVPHLATYGDPLVGGKTTPSGKLLFTCLICGRETPGAEKECRTVGMLAA